MRGAGTVVLLLTVVLAGCVRAFEPHGLVPAGDTTTGDSTAMDAGAEGVASDAAKAADVLPRSDGWLKDWGAVPPSWCTCQAADLDGSGVVDQKDFDDHFQPCFGGPGTGSCAASDFDGDGQVTTADFQCFLIFFHNSPVC